MDDGPGVYAAGARRAAVTDSSTPEQLMASGLMWKCKRLVAVELEPQPR